MNASSDSAPLRGSGSWSKQEAKQNAKQNATGMDEVAGQFAPALWRLAGSFEFDASLREELVQDMLVAVWQALPRLEDPSSLKASVLRIARNRAVSDGWGPKATASSPLVGATGCSRSGRSWCVSDLVNNMDEWLDGLDLLGLFCQRLCFWRVCIVAPAFSSLRARGRLSCCRSRSCPTRCLVVCAGRAFRVLGEYSGPGLYLALDAGCRMDVRGVGW
ncbi:MAG: hypothetical protein EA418_13015 [Wenzhouxiangellaceae bacterium]|nr:MAG: hypothetical protein EA418_13015 [Wenzhouxiangellaceae bacterium]